MKIAFIIAGQFPVYSLEEIKNSDSWAYDENAYKLVKTLEKNEGLENAVKKLRPKLAIPKDGLDFYDYYNLEEGQNNLPDDSEDKIFFEKWKKLVEEESQKLFKKLKLPEAIKDNLQYIVIGNFVYPFQSKFSIWSDTLWEEDGKYSRSRLNIVVLEKFSKNELFKFINSHWEDIKKYHMETLPDEKHLGISSRDYRIIELRDERKLKFREIAERIVDEFRIDNADAKINEDSVKTAYKRAKNKIASLIKTK